MLRLTVLLTVLLLAVLPRLQAAEPQDPPTEEPASADALRIDKVERETVRLVLLDVLVMDAGNRTVDGLTAEDFEVRTDGRWVPVDTLDVRCDDGPLGDPRGVRAARDRTPLEAPDEGRRIVMAFDYQHLTPIQRTDVLERAREMVRHNKVDGDEIMVAALNGGLRVEQPFTEDRQQVLDVLKRMEYDITLWNGNFAHQTEKGFVRGLTSLLDVASATPGQKAMLFFSAMNDVPLDLEFKQIAAHAAASRCAIYPVDAIGMRGRLEDLAIERSAMAAMRPG